MKKLCFLFLSMILMMIVSAQENDYYVADSTEVAEPATVSPPVEDEEYYEEDYEEPLPLYFPEDSINDIRNQKEYDYMRNLDSLLRNLNLEIKQEPDAPSKSIFDISIIKGLIWALAIIAVLYMLYQLFAGQQGLFAKNKKLDIVQDVEQQTDRSLSPLILSQQAVARGDYRQAVRYQYVYLLQLLAEKNMIVLLPQKTNSHYLSEVRQRPFYGDFARLTLQYEYVWYGEFKLTKEQYDMVESGFRKFIGTWL